MRPWALSLHGHAYTSAYLLLGLALGLAGARGGRERWLRLAAFALGFLSNYMLLTAAFVVCAAPLVGAILAARDWRSAREGLWLALFTGLGPHSGLRCPLPAGREPLRALERRFGASSAWPAAG